MKPLQKGMTLIEMVIAISLLAIMISAIVFSFDGSKSRAQVLVAARGSCHRRRLRRRAHAQPHL